MDKAETLDAFFNSFSWDAYEENTVPTDDKGNVTVDFPYISYSAPIAKMGTSVYPYAKLWDYDTSWERVSRKAQEIGDSLGEGGTTIRFENGLMFIVQGSPFAQKMSDPNPAIRCILLNFIVEFMSLS